MDIEMIEALAETASDLLRLGSYGLPYFTMNGVEIQPDWFNIYSDKTGQSKSVVLHEPTGFVFKNFYGNVKWGKQTASGTYIGECVLDDVTYQIRLPRFFLLSDGDIIAQEYIDAPIHDCSNVSYGHCEHVPAVRDATGYYDSHVGNWRIFNGEIVLFDFD